MVLCGGFSAEVRAKKMRQDGCAEFISASLVKQAHDRLRNEVFAWRMQTAHHNIYPFL